MRGYWLVALAVLVLAGCKGTTRIEKEYIHDTTRVVDVRVDSVDRWHAHYEYLKGETVMVLDTFYYAVHHYHHDTVQKKTVEYRDRDVERIKEKKMYVWKPFAAIAAAVVAAAGVAVYKSRKK